ncbi:CDP-alcohol phosphatidyltransferase [Wenjunlia vitaminophila]|uniref:CDP-alcohol phosphatidyltransferase n=1 Tax=Wenjunlia vitaminophila TaxID=76728 RepID=A0A0T6LLB4_WENVI|nr:CDP-alcohol phosphatidyltransferase family protein [Wenjunlia vitaminophila]KRV46671.1 CDP-alcohol phosphatidyltransferase [Wenjunlia vitaminophila]
MSGFGQTLRELAAAQKSGKGVSFYSRLVNRPAGRVLAAAAHRLGLTPNQVTLVSAGCTGGAIATIAVASPTRPVAVGVFAALVVGFALDSADGQLARLTGTQHPSGEWLDHLVDCAKLLFLHMAVLISFYRFFDLPDTAFLLVPIVFQGAAVLVFFGGVLTEQLKRAAAANAPVAPPPAPPSTLRSLALLPADYGLFCAVFLFLGDHDVFLVLYCAFLAAQVLFLVAFCVKWFRELSRV